MPTRSESSLANLNRGGRPKGKPNKVASDLAALCRTYTKAATRKIVQIMKDKNTPPGVALAAANSLLDRGYGKPRQEMQHRFDPRALTDDELAILIAIEKRLAGIDGAAGGGGETRLIEGSLAGAADAGPQPASEPSEVPDP